MAEETKTNTTNTATKLARYDILSSQYESNGDPGCVSSGSGDAGGVSYGLWQLSSTAGSAKSFVEFCVSQGYSCGPTLSAAGDPGTDSFSSAWKTVATQDPTGFTEAQYQYILGAYFEPGCAAAASVGIDLNKHSDALKCVVWSASVQYSSGNIADLFQDAATVLSQPISVLDDAKYDSDLIQAIYQVRATDEWTSGSPDLRPGLRERFTNECNDALILLSGDGAAISKLLIRGKIADGKNGKASDDGFSIKMKRHGKHADSVITKLPKGKTFCEPVYPDLVTVSDKIPQWLLEKANIATEKMVDTGMLVYSIPTQVLEDACGGDLDAILGGAANAKERQRIFDPTKYKSEFKKSNPGKPANNNDPFPVDLKIEELETHKPTVKVHTITCCPEAVSTAKAVINVSDRAEKRIVKLENMMATMLRYLFRIGTRMNVNCVYYGGQTPFEKYNAIRCLQDDRISDGQSMSLDQCMNCTRYEPIIGQVYEIMNDLGVNLASVLDDNQMAYMDMKDYVDFTRTENYHEEKEKAEINMSGVTTRSALEKDFKDTWPAGIKMKWDLVPVEQQKPHINWRQNINDDGTKLKKLTSFPQDEKNIGTPITTKPANTSIMKKNADAMDANSNAVLQSRIDVGKAAGAGMTDELVNKMKAGLEKEIKSKMNGDADIDPLIIAAIMAIENVSDPGPVINRYSEVMETLQIKNPAIVISAYKAEATTFLGDETITPKLPRIDKVVKPDATDSGVVTTFNLNWDSRETWLWTQFFEPMEINLNTIGAASSKPDMLNFFPEVCYMYMELTKVARSSKFDGDIFAFPFIEEQLKGVWYVSKFGMRQLDSETEPRMHRGIDLATGDEGAGMEIHAIADGVVVDGSGWADWNGVLIQHENNYFSRYLHNSSVLVSAGQTVLKGDVIAGVGCTGSPGCYHLHVEIGQGDIYQKETLDPMMFWPLLEDKLGDGGAPLSER